jgi:hypothetical protein
MNAFVKAWCTNMLVVSKLQHSQNYSTSFICCISRTGLKIYILWTAQKYVHNKNSCLERQQLQKILQALKYTKCWVDINYVQLNSRTQTTIFVELIFYCEFCSTKIMAVVTGWGFSYVTSFTDYRRTSALCVQALMFHVHITAASHNLLTKMEKYRFLTVQ